jgi:hypothetical protein
MDLLLGHQIAGQACRPRRTLEVGSKAFANNTKQSNRIESASEYGRMDDTCPMEETTSSQHYPPSDVFLQSISSDTTAEGGVVVVAAPPAIVNGIGLWNAFAKNFQTSLLAFLDLLDNAVDAVDIDAHHANHDNKFNNNNNDDDEDENDSTSTLARAYISIDSERAGISLINTCAKEIPVLQKIFELYSSKKGDTPEIGENGIGLKQGCACLSDLSLICTKSDYKTFQLGIIAKSLQTETSVLLPSLVFKSASTIREELIAWLNGNESIQQTVQQYGDEGDLQDAITRVENHFIKLQDDYCDHPNVFGLFLHQVKQGKGGSSSNRSGGLLDELAEDLPHRYLHIPDTVRIAVREKRVQFNYWQIRLVEMTEFKLFVNPSVWLRDDDYWLDGRWSGNAPNHKAFRLYIGFDALRVVDKNLDSNPHLYIYSRSSGRKIVKYKDARNVLDMGAAGSTYSQGLTILLDDCETSLPLNPTKQDTAFADCSTGEIFQKNLYMWIKASVRVYYNRYWEVLYHKKKTLLTEALRALVPAIKAFNPETLSKSMAESNYGSFGNFASSVFGDTIRLVCNASKTFTPGKDVLFRLQGEKAAAPGETTPTASRKRKSIDAAATDDTTNKKMPGCDQRSRFFAGMIQPPPATTSSSQPLDIGEDDDDTKVVSVELGLLRRKADKYELMKNKKKTAEEQSVELRKQLAAAKDDNAELNRQLVIAGQRDAAVNRQLMVAGQREQATEDRVKELEGQLAVEQAKSAEQTLQYQSDLMDKDDEIILLKTQAEYWKKRRDDLLAVQNDDGDSSDDDEE